MYSSLPAVYAGTHSLLRTLAGQWGEESDVHREVVTFRDLVTLPGLELLLPAGEHRQQHCSSRINTLWPS